MSNELALKVEKLLIPVLGEFIAKATVAKYCKTIGTTSDDLTHANLKELADKMEGVLTTFAGASTAKSICDEVRSM